MVRDVYNIRAWKQHDYVNDDINLLMLFAQIENDLDEDTLSYFRSKGMENYEETVDYAIVIAYSFMQYSLKRGLKGLG